MLEVGRREYPINLVLLLVPVVLRVVQQLLLLVLRDAEVGLVDEREVDEYSLLDHLVDSPVAFE